jgi:hypothetical protein
VRQLRRCDRRCSRSHCRREIRVRTLRRIGRRRGYELGRRCRPRVKRRTYRCIPDQHDASVHCHWQNSHVRASIAWCIGDLHGAVIPDCPIARTRSRMRAITSQS